MAGISDKAALELVNKYKYNGIEHTTDLDLNQYDAFYRTLDPQIGRFWQIDPETESLESYSPYTSMENNPISDVDPLGNYGSRFSAWIHKIFNGGGTILKNKFGEYYIRRTSYEGPEKGVTVSISYGKGRDKYSNAREALIRDIQIEQDIQKNGKNSLYKMYNSQEEAGRAALSLGTGVVLPNPILKSGTIVANVERVATESEAGKLITTEIEISEHAAQRMAERGITIKMVKAALAKGAKYFDPSNGTFNYVLKNGFASGKDLLVGTNPLTGKISTVIRGKNLVNARFIPQ